MSAAAANIQRSDHYGELQNVVDALFAEEAADLPEELLEVVRLLPPSTFTRQRLCDQLNSSIGGHAWGQVYGTVE